MRAEGSWEETGVLQGPFCRGEELGRDQHCLCSLSSHPVPGACSHPCLCHPLSPFPALGQVQCWPCVTQSHAPLCKVPWLGRAFSTVFV